MHGESSVVVDRGRYQDAVTPWEQEAWRAAALGWVKDALVSHGLREAGPRRVRLRPWSVLVRLSVEGRGAVWFKANPPASAFEAGLTEALAGWVPEHVLKPLAVDTDRGWSLLPDGGRLFRDVLDGGGLDDPRAWEELLRQYADIQHALLGHTEKIESLGVPSARTTALPGLFDRLVAENARLTPADRKRLSDLRPRLVEWCEELADTGIGDSLDHADLHDGQIFVRDPGRFTFFDWGDAAVSHPFCSFLVTAQHARDRYGPEALPRLRDAYLEPWTGDGHTVPELRRALSLAWRLAAIGRAGSWGRLFPGAHQGLDSQGPDSAGDAQSAHWLLELDTEPPL
ncbi:aminoglycoside phosphotransferase family protein [Streptomyces sp. NPDC050704]|uniref:aminoglycoside phosphotransferase family protein n=1 Tax=Streptomyces sp. NPDC050704 TaxID=3157219 RepID=UPI0034309A28